MNEKRLCNKKKRLCKYGFSQAFKASEIFARDITSGVLGTVCDASMMLDREDLVSFCDLFLDALCGQSEEQRNSVRDRCTSEILHLFSLNLMPQKSSRIEYFSFFLEHARSFYVSLSVWFVNQTTLTFWPAHKFRKLQQI